MDLADYVLISWASRILPGFIHEAIIRRDHVEAFTRGLEAYELTPLE